MSAGCKLESSCKRSTTDRIMPACAVASQTASPGWGRPWCTRRLEPRPCRRARSGVYSSTCRRCRRPPVVCTPGPYMHRGHRQGSNPVLLRTLALSMKLLRCATHRACHDTPDRYAVSPVARGGSDGTCNNSHQRAAPPIILLTPLTRDCGGPVVLEPCRRCRWGGQFWSRTFHTSER